MTPGGLAAERGRRRLPLRGGLVRLACVAGQPIPLAPGCDVGGFGRRRKGRVAAKPPPRGGVRPGCPEPCAEKPSEQGHVRWLALAVHVRAGVTTVRRRASRLVRRGDGLAGSRYSLAAAKAVVQRAVPASRELRRVGNGRRCRHPGVATSWLVGRGWRAFNPMGACHPSFPRGAWSCYGSWRALRAYPPRRRAASPQDSTHTLQQERIRARDDSRCESDRAHVTATPRHITTGQQTHFGAHASQSQQ